MFLRKIHYANSIVPSTEHTINAYELNIYSKRILYYFGNIACLAKSNKHRLVSIRTGGGEYHQLSFTHAGKGHTLYVRPHDFEEVSEAVANYRKFRELTNCWIELEMAFAKASRSAIKRVPNDSTEMQTG